MPDTPEDLVDHARTARRFTGEEMKNIRHEVRWLANHPNVRPEPPTG